MFRLRISVLMVLLALATLYCDAVLPEFLTSAPPDALTFKDGRHVRTAREWQERRTEILQDFAQKVYGVTPSVVLPMRARLESTEKDFLNGKAELKQIAIQLGSGETNVTIHVQYLLPLRRTGRVPTFVGLSFRPNDTVATSSQWQPEQIIDNGFGLATAYYFDIEPDRPDAGNEGVRRLLSPNKEWGALGAWAWGLSRIADYLVTDPDCDAHRLVLIGHSRLGKAGLWAAAQDTRFAVVISNESGVGGASLYRTRTGEAIEHLNTAFPHWFSPDFHRYTGHPDETPVDGNLLLSLIAPRPLYVASAELDKQSNPPAEFYSAVLASQVYELLGKKGLGTHTMPDLKIPIMKDVGYHWRPGKHDVTAFDWECYLQFARQHLVDVRLVNAK